ncbi:E3 ubiquitin-protein ligase znrf2 [Onychostoma macrolepis]|uniref:E3 ubiquitin-protein ligase znrf2 n=1 Tax=Onychostoma macrolepis TaxID=369639 RepID=UPI00272C97A7|nr:E3 ubiquitin-protein ligase znrf2 [Onychostoma macrolepis]XP_058603245.1 E3 ubiquitin-protein ligase znrf2 [Onychostoma macrolepis]
MGAKQSSPAENGRTRAYSGSDLPSSNGGRTTAVAMRFPVHGASGATSSSSSSSAALASHYTGSRTRSVGGGTGGPGARPQSSINIPTSGAYSSQDSGNSTPEENGGERERSTGAPRLLIGSLPAHLSPHLFGGFKCPVCSKFISSDEMDLHLVMCLTKPRVTYNEDVLAKDAGECAICLEELVQGDTIARLPCLCIYHKGCIDEWFEVNRSCPEHPSD